MRAAAFTVFSLDDAERKSLSQSQRAAIRARLEATLARLEATATFPWRDPLDAVHEENGFQRDTELLGEEGALLWAKFDKEMDRLHATQFPPDARSAG
jgi:multidrug efflux pump subunit AcrA (membrane-fusion protein)